MPKALLILSSDTLSLPCTETLIHFWKIFFITQEILTLFKKSYSCLEKAQRNLDHGLINFYLVLRNYALSIKTLIKFKAFLILTWFTGAKRSTKINFRSTFFEEVNLWVVLLMHNNIMFRLGYILVVLKSVDLLKYQVDL